LFKTIQSILPKAVKVWLIYKCGLFIKCKSDFVAYTASSQQFYNFIMLHNITETDSEF